MAAQNLQVGNASRPADVISVSQVSTDSEAIVTGSALNASVFNGVAYTLGNSGANSIDVTVYRANKADFTDEDLAVAAIAVAAGAVEIFQDAPTVFRFYRVKVAATAGGSQGVLDAEGVAR